MADEQNDAPDEPVVPEEPVASEEPVAGSPEPEPEPEPEVEDAQVAAEDEAVEATDTDAEDSEPREPAPVAAAPPTPAPAARGGARAARRRERRSQPSGEAPVVRAVAKYVRTAPRKARLIADLVRGKDVEEARAILAHSTRSAAQDWSKVLESAVANAENNHELIGEDLFITAVTADDGPTLKRFQPRAQGRAYRINKRTSHLTVQLTPKDEV